jgi:cyclic pyranopterin phosphate synthase
MSRPYANLRSAERVDLAKSVPLPGPMAAYLEVTNICNFKCSFCPESFSNYKERAGGLFKSDDAAVYGVLDQFAEIGTLRTLNFYMMGEPFVHKSLPAFVRYAKDVHAAQRVIVTSNGTLLLPRVFEVSATFFL